jgi:hypothetical protein
MVISVEFDQRGYLSMDANSDPMSLEGESSCQTVGIEDRSCLFQVFLFLLAMAVLLGLIVGVVAAIDYFLNRPFEELEPHLASYLEISDLEPYDGRPYIVGRIVPIDTREEGGGSFSRSVYRRLPESLRTKNPNEVGTIALFSWSETVVAHYFGDKKAYRQTCLVTLVDFRRRRVIASIRFEGPDPEVSETTSRSYSGRKPLEEMMSFLTNGCARLPLREPGER